MDTEIKHYKWNNDRKNDNAEYGITKFSNIGFKGRYSLLNSLGNKIVLPNHPENNK